MFALFKPLDLCYLHEQQSTESHLEQSHELIYEQMMFHKLFAINWSGFISLFDRSLLIDQMNQQVFFFSEKDARFTSSMERLKQFLKLGFINPDELANKLASKDLLEGVQIIQDHLASINPKKVTLPLCTEVPELVPLY